MKKIIQLTESDLTRIVRKVINHQNIIFESEDNIITESVGEHNFYPGCLLKFKKNKKYLGEGSYLNFKTANIYDQELSDILFESKIKYKNDEDNVFIHTLFVNENLRGFGYGKNVLSKLLNECKNKNFKRAIFVVDRDNITALKLYEKFNFVTIYKNNDKILGEFFLN